MRVRGDGTNRRVDDGILLTFRFCFGVVTFSEVDYVDDINSDAVQLWKTSD